MDFLATSSKSFYDIWQSDQIKYYNINGSDDFNEQMEFTLNSSERMISTQLRDIHYLFSESTVSLKLLFPKFRNFHSNWRTSHVSICFSAARQSDIRQKLQVCKYYIDHLFTKQHCCSCSLLKLKNSIVSESLISLVSRGAKLISPYNFNT